jgi:hypothetical protein
MSLWVMNSMYLQLLSVHADGHELFTHLINGHLQCQIWFFKRFHARELNISSAFYNHINVKLDLSSSYKVLHYVPYQFDADFLYFFLASTFMTESTIKMIYRP